MTHPFPPSESTETVYLLKTQTPTQTHANLYANPRKPLRKPTQTYANLYANPRKPYANTRKRYANLNLDANPTQTYGNLYANIRKLYANPTQTLRKPTQTSEGGVDVENFCAHNPYWL